MKIRSFVLTCSIFVFFVNGSWATPASQTNITGKYNQQFEQRSLYLDAKRAYEVGDVQTFQQYTSKLTIYPLYPYLLSLELGDRLDDLPYYDVDQFLLDYGDTVVGKQLLSEWLSVLAEKKHWHDYRSYFTEDIKLTVLQCYHLWARIQTADKTAFEEVSKLWNVKHSQPDNCDPLFSEWIKQGYLSDGLLWSRYKKAVANKQHRLVRYLKSLAKAKYQPYFAGFKSIHQSPEKGLKSNFLTQTNTYTKDIIEYGLSRLQRLNAQKALPYFRTFEARAVLSDDFKELFLARNKRSEINQYSLEEIAQSFHLAPSLTIEDDLIDRLLLQAVREQNWNLYIVWYDKLSIQGKNKDQWNYWLARALNTNSNQQETANKILKLLSQKRSYYGFLAADTLQQPFALQDKPLNVDNNLLLEVNHIPAIARARELFLTKDVRSARREWRDGSKGLSLQAIEASAQLAHEWGWHRKAIEMLGSIKAWDHLAVRFPVIHQDFIEKKAKRFNYSSSLIYAIARQESAWQQDATSHAGARGLMQLIPSTAKDAAKKVGIKHQKSQLYLPEHNILLGSFHIKELLEKYNNNRVPAIAAYNAGQHRVNQWMKKSNGTLPYDVWIETIPFAETRKYVKNVLYYSALYDYRAGNMINLLSQLERDTFL